MWSKEEAKNRKKRFYTAFGIYMKKHRMNYDSRIRWVNYRTGVNGIKFRLDTDNKNAFVCIDIVQKDAGVREIFFEQFQEFSAILNSTIPNLVWLKSYYLNNGEEISRIYTCLENTSMNNEENWGVIFKFFEKNLVALHEFWELSQDVFKELDD